MDGDFVIIVKFMIGLRVTGKAVLALILAIVRVGKDNLNRKDWFIAFTYVLMSLVPVLRLIGLIVQAMKKGSYVRAGCLEYQISFANQPSIREIDPYKLDYQNNYQWDTFYLMGRDEDKFYNENNATLKRLYVKPFNSQCMLAVDYLYLIGLGLCFVMICFYFFVLIFELVFNHGEGSKLFADTEEPGNDFRLWEVLKKTDSSAKLIGQNWNFQMQSSQIVVNRSGKDNHLALMTRKMRFDRKYALSVHLGDDFTVVENLKQKDNEEKENKKEIKTKESSQPKKEKRKPGSFISYLRQKWKAVSSIISGPLMLIGLIAGVSFVVVNNLNALDGSRTSRVRQGISEIPSSLSDSLGSYKNNDTNAILILFESSKQFVDSVIMNMASNQLTRKAITEDKMELKIDGACSVVYRLGLS